MIGAIPTLLVVGFLVVVIKAHGISKHPDNYAADTRVWNIVATTAYFYFEANFWQADAECTQYDAELLYVPSEGCVLTNKEFTTELNFSGGVRISRGSSSSEPAMLLLGDSVTMGWGVNDQDTFSSLVAAKIPVPVLNLGVSSYGTVREILWARRNPRFRDSSCVIVQYSMNDFTENEIFLKNGSLPAPVAARYKQLLAHETREVRFRDIIALTFTLMRASPISFFSDVYGLSNFDYSPRDGRQRSITEDADVFLRVIGSFPELSKKHIFVFGPDVPKGFFSALHAKSSAPNVFPLKIELRPVERYTLDMHPNKKGHQKIAEDLLSELARHEAGAQCLSGDFSKAH
jgi:lysophospholipase L1-like esterase